MITLEQVYEFNKILKIKCIKDEVEKIIKGFNVKKIKLNNGIWECYFETPNGDYLSLDIEMVRYGITIYKQSKNRVERLTVCKDLKMTHEIVEKRPVGIIYSIINKQFDISNRFQNDFVLVDIEEKRMVFTKETLEKLIDKIKFESSKLTTYFLKFRMLKMKVELSKECDYCTDFSTHMNNYANWESGRKIKDNIYPTKTYLNGEDVSMIFDVIDDKDKLYRVYDLYNGIINQRNEEDICLINYGFLSSDAYDLKSLRRITEQEEKIVGKSLEEQEEYLNYLKEMLYQKFGFNDELQLNRNSILSGITYQRQQNKAKEKGPIKIFRMIFKK